MRRMVIGAATGWMLTVSGGAMAQALTWRISEASGPVTVQHGTEMRPAQRGATLTEGDTVSTGVGGRAVLVHDRDFVTVAPNSRVAVPERAAASGLTKLLQTLGNAVYKIEKLGVPHFGVTTPYLAAVVKGTTFSVTVDASGSALQVTEGAVEVATLDGGARDLIRPGDVATIAVGDLLRLRVQGDRDRVIDSPAHAAAPISTAAAEETAAAPAPSATPAPLEAPATGTTTQVETGADARAAPDLRPTAITEAISSKPTDLGAATGGLLTGTVGTPAIAAVTVVAALTASDARAIASPPTIVNGAEGMTLAPSPAEPSRAGGAAATGENAGSKQGIDAPAKEQEDGGGDAHKAADEVTRNAENVASDATAHDTVGGTTQTIADDAAKDAKKAADDAAKAQEQADRDAQKAADDAAKDAKKAADDAAKAQEKAERDAQKAADDAARDAKKAADDAARAQEKADRDAQKAADDAAKDAKKAADDAAKDAKKAADDLVKKLAEDTRKDADKLVDLPGKLKEGKNPGRDRDDQEDRRGRDD